MACTRAQVYDYCSIMTGFPPIVSNIIAGYIPFLDVSFELNRRMTSDRSCPQNITLSNDKIFVFRDIIEYAPTSSVCDLQLRPFGTHKEFQFPTGSDAPLITGIAATSNYVFAILCDRIAMLDTDGKLICTALPDIEPRAYAAITIAHNDENVICLCGGRPWIIQGEGPDRSDSVIVYDVVKKRTIKRVTLSLSNFQICGFAFDGRDCVYLAERSNARIHYVNLHSGKITKFGGREKLQDPTDIVLLDNDFLAVTNFSHKELQVWRVPSGEFVSQYELPFCAWAIAYRNGILYVHGIADHAQFHVTFT